MPQKTNLNISPYYDDYDSNKNFYRVLFKPGYPVQARELTTLQSILQNQIESFGSHIFKEGSMVIPGSVTYDDNYFSVQIEDTNFGVPVTLYLKELVGKIIRGQNSGITATIQNYSIPPSEDTENVTLYVKYLESGVSNSLESSRFLDGESLVIQDNVIYGNTTILSGDTIGTTIQKNSTAVGSAVGITKGIYFIRGTFVQVSDSILILDPFSNKTSYRVGLSITEEFVTASEDSSLTDGARGFSNFAAPGADRLKISTTLSKKSLDDFNDTNFVEIIKIQDGKIKKLQDTSVYSIIRDYFAKRTYDESGDYALNQFKIDIQNSLNDRISNDGIYLPSQKTEQGNDPNDDLMCVKISSGKAYVRGYDLDFPGTTIIDVPKPRQTESVGPILVPFEVGNLLKVINVTGSPIVGIESPNNKIDLRNKFRGESGISTVGTARVYTFNLSDAPYESQKTQWDLYLFDIQTYTVLNVTESLSTAECPASSYIRGLSSGASGFVVDDANNSNQIKLVQTSGSFMVGESISINENRSISRSIRSFKAYTIDDIKSVYQNSSPEFKADSILYKKAISNFNLGDKVTISSTGTVTIPARAGQNFLGIKTDSIIRYQRGGSSGVSTETFNRVDSISSDGFTMELKPLDTHIEGIYDNRLPSSTIETTISLGVPSISGQTNSSLFVPLRNKNISNVDLSDADLLVTRQFNGLTVTNIGTLIVNMPTDGGISTSAFFETYDAERYSITYSDGTIEPLTSDQFTLNSGGTQIQFTGLVPSSTVNLNTTIRKTQVRSKTKVFVRSEQLIVNKTSVSAASSITGLSTSPYYGLRVEDREISLNVPDVVEVIAVYESLTTSAPELDSLSFTVGYNLNLNSVIGERIIGNTSGAIAQLVTRSPNQVGFVYLNSKTFSETESVTFEESNITANIQKITKGKYQNITSKYILDKNQKNQYYDYSKLVRAETSSAPLRQLLVVFNYLDIPNNDNGDIITINSYNQNLISKGVATLDNNLRTTDTLDFRPRVNKFTLPNISPFDYNAKVFQTTQSNTILSPNESSIISYNYYLPRIDRVVLNKLGQFSIIQGNSSLNPKVPLNVEEAMDVATISLPAYLYDPDDAIVTLVDNRRYTMRDIGKLEDRIENLEYVTSLSLLELDTKTLQIQDADGLSRFKTGFFVDDFKNTDLIEKNNSDVRCDVDFTNKELVTPVDFVSIKAELALATDISPLTADFSRNLRLLDPNVQKTGDLITLKYEEREWIKQPFASEYENVNPFNIITYTGEVKLTPASDTWVRNIYIEIIKVITNTSVNITRSVNRARSGWWWGWPDLNKNWWNSPAGKFSTTETFPGTDSAFNSGQKNGVPFTGRPGGGISFDYVESVNTYSEPDPFMRSRNVQFEANGLKPLTQHYGFMDGSSSIDIIPKLVEISMVSGSFIVGETVIVSFVSKDSRIIGSFRLAQPNHKTGTYNNPEEIYEVNPYERTTTIPSTYSASSKILNIDTFSLAEESISKYGGYIEKGAEIIGETSGAIAKISDIRLVTDNVGDLIGSFFIRDPNENPAPLFRIKTGDRTFKLNADSTNQSITSKTADQISEASAVYKGSGLIKTEVTTLVKVRIPPPPPPPSPPIVQAPRRDPLAQSFTVDETGAFLTSVDVYFYSKDPVQNLFVELRTVELGLPTNQLVQDYARVTLKPSKIKTSADASIPTKITFPSPIHLEPNTEYALVFLAPTTNNYNMWVATMGKKTIASQNLPDAESVYITRQYLGGSLYKSQNGTIWTPSQFQDLKFTLYKAKFASKTGEVVFYNPSITNGGFQDGDEGDIVTTLPAIPTPTNPCLPPNPIRTIPRKIRVGIVTSSIVTRTKFLPGRKVGWQKAFGYVEKIGGPLKPGSVTIINPGIGYSASYTFSNVPLYSITGSGRGAVASSVVFSDGKLDSIVISGVSTGNGYMVGDILGITTSSVSKGRGARISVSDIGAVDTLILDNVQGEKFEGGFNTLYYIDQNNNKVSLGSTEAITSEVVSPIFSGNIIEITHRNHGLNGRVGKVKLNNIAPNTIPVEVTSQIDKDSTVISVANTSEFTVFEGKTTNTGYVIVNNEVMQYTGIGQSILTVVRGQANTRRKPHSNGAIVQKYEISGFSLTKINKVHKIEETVDKRISVEEIVENNDVDKYYLEIIPDDNDRKSGEEMQNFTTGGFCGGVPGINNPMASQNHQFNSIVPQFNIITPGQNTSVSAQIRTISGTSVGGNESSYIDQGYQSVELNKSNFFNSPRLVASVVNEKEYLTDLPSNKSLSLRIRMNSDDENLSPVLDLQTSLFVLGRNKINNPISDYASDGRVNVTEGDPHSALYISKRIDLKQASTSLKLYVSAYRPPGTDFRVLYQLFKPDSSEVNQSFNLFPGYDNIVDTGVGYEIVDPSLNSGRPDIYVRPSRDNEFLEYQFTADNLDKFTGFAIKIVMSSINEAYPVKFKDLRCIALA